MMAALANEDKPERSGAAAAVSSLRMGEVEGGSGVSRTGPWGRY